jgi:hypothetical protein
MKLVYKNSSVDLESRNITLRMLLPLVNKVTGLI